MTRKDVLINIGPGETRVAIVEDGRLAELSYERAPADEDGLPGPRGIESHLGDIFLGRVQRVLPGVQAAFIDIGLSRAGFLSARDARRLRDYTGEDRRPEAPPITALVREGEAILVQVAKDPIGDKGARMTAGVTLAGRLLIFVPEHPLFALSRRITNEADRARLLEAVEALSRRGLERHGIKSGFIVRTAALEASGEELAEDAERLWAQWLQVRAAAGRREAPARLYRELGPVAKTLRDYVDRDTARVLIDDPMAFAEAKRYALEVLPALAERIVHYNETEALFEAHGIEAEIEALMSPRVALPSGGWITIETTEALTAIDVNSGSLETSCLEETGLRTNLDAAREIGRQLRLRGIGGLIVIDFIHMDDPSNVTALTEALGSALARDRTPVQMTPLSPFGLVEITRKRVREPLGRLLTGACTACAGHGRTKSAGTVANEALRRLAREARAQPGRSLRLRLAPEVAGWLTARAKSVLDPVRARLAVPIAIEPVRHFTRERYEIDTSNAVVEPPVTQPAPVAVP